MDSCTTWVAALGRTGQIGDFYDIRTNSLVTGVNHSSQRPPLKVFEPSTGVAGVFILGDSFRDKCHHLNVCPDLQLSVLAGSVKPSGSGKWLLDRKRSSRVSSCTVFRKIVSRAESVHFPANRRAQDLPSGATHVVTAVEYGVHIVVTFKRRLDDAWETDDVDGVLAAQLEDLKPKLLAITEGLGPVELTKQEIWRLRRLRARVLGDFGEHDGNSSQPPASGVDAALAYMQSVPALVRANKVEGVPLRFGLLALDGVQQPCVRQSTVESLVDLFGAIDKRRQELCTLADVTKKYEYAVVPEDKTHLEQLCCDLEKFETDLKSGLVTARNSDASQLEELQEKLTKDPRSPSSTGSIWEVGELSHRLLRARTFVDQMLHEGIRFLTQEKSADRVLRSHQGKYVYILRTNQEHHHRNEDKTPTYHQQLFIAAARQAKARAPTDVYYVDCFSRDQKERIEFYRDANLCYPDMGSLTHLPAASPHGHVVTATEKPKWRVPVRLPCPASLKGRCAPGAVFWRCWNCHEALATAGVYFYCSCGRCPAADFQFLCADLQNHGFVMETFDPDILEPLLQQLNQECRRAMLSE